MEDHLAGRRRAHEEVIEPLGAATKESGRPEPRRIEMRRQLVTQAGETSMSVTIA
jgi:hypothetical protein